MVDIAYPDIREPNPTMIGVLPFYHIYGKLFSYLDLPFLPEFRVSFFNRGCKVAAFSLDSRHARGHYAEIRPCRFLPVHREIQGNSSSRCPPDVSGVVASPWYAFHYP